MKTARVPKGYALFFCGTRTLTRSGGNCIREVRPEKEAIYTGRAYIYFVAVPTPPYARLSEIKPKQSS